MQGALRSGKRVERWRKDLSSLHRQTPSCHYAVYDSSNGNCTLFDAGASTTTGADTIIWKDCRKS